VDVRHGHLQQPGDHAVRAVGGSLALQRELTSIAEVERKMASPARGW
jgi:hypothetical protein